jgi:hypothetical protein
MPRSSHKKNLLATLDGVRLRREHSGMTLRNLSVLGLGVAGLLAVVAFVANGGPLGTAAEGGSGGATLPSTFGDFVFTTAAILAVLVAAALTAVLLGRGGRFPLIGGDYVEGLFVPLLGLLTVFVVLGAAEKIFLAYHHTSHPPHDQNHYLRYRPHGKVNAESAHFVWWEAELVGALLLLAVAIFVVTRRRRRVAPPPLPLAPHAVAAALDESLDDLRADPDLHRAIMAAYARMEAAIGAGGTPRKPSEAPREYLERALASLDASGSAVARLTELFELARFSAHEPEPEMRDEAIRALTAVRDELRQTIAVAA